MAKEITHIETAQKEVARVGNAAVLSLSDAYLALGLIRPASTSGAGWRDLVGTYKPSIIDTIRGKVVKADTITPQTASAEQPETIQKVRSVSTHNVDRYDYTKLWSLKLGDYYMPLSQTFSLRAKKRLNVSSLVDGIDIIQQTRKEAKTIDCTLRIALRDDIQRNLEIERTTDNGSVDSGIAVFARFLEEFYDNDAVFEIRNSMINETFGVRYVFISEYHFTPTVGKGTFQFNFALTEVIYGDDVLTFDVREITGE